jgi:hypothetical protein
MDFFLPKVVESNVSNLTQYDLAIFLVITYIDQQLTRLQW